MIKQNFISQITGVCCAMCGYNNKVSNCDYDNETLELVSDGTFRIKNMKIIFIFCFNVNIVQMDIEFHSF